MNNVDLSLYGRLGNNIMQLLDAIYYCNARQGEKISYDFGEGFVGRESLGNIGSILPCPFECRLPSGTDMVFTNKFRAKLLPFNASEKYSFGPGSTLPRAIEAFSTNSNPLQLKSFNRDIKFLPESS